jgi:hypothetical protein
LGPEQINARSPNCAQAALIAATAPAKRQLACNNNGRPGSGDTLDNAGEYVPDRVALLANTGWGYRKLPECWPRGRSA